MPADIDDEETATALHETGTARPVLPGGDTYGRAVVARTQDEATEDQRTLPHGFPPARRGPLGVYQDDVTIEYDLPPREADRELSRATVVDNNDTREPPKSRRGEMASTLPPNATFRLAILPRPLEDAAPGPPSITAGPRFEPRHTLGVGSNGEVMLEYDRDIERTVAVKRMRGPHDPEALLRFAEEVRTIGGMEHPNIVPVHDVGIDEHQRYYFVMKYLEGETLEKIIKRLAAGDLAYQQRFTHARRTDICMEIMNAVAYAHARGIVHRDLKPANVMVGRYGEVMVMDWGVAKKIRGRDGAPSQRAEGRAIAEGGEELDANDELRLFKTMNGALIGTPLYMSPEQANSQNDAIDERSDIYSLSVMFHELFALHHYLEGETELLAVLDRVTRPDDRPLTAFVGDLFQSTFPCELMHFFRKGMRKAPAERYQSMTEMIEAFQQTRTGKFKIQCYYTLIKRGAQGLLHFVDNHPIFVTVAFATAVISVPMCMVLLLLSYV